jgi:hydrogenase nickel incorporation protein HypA/HybF
MHELRIAEDLSAIVLETAIREKLSIVSKVNISFGQMIQIVPEIFEFAFRECVKNSVAENADLNIEIIPIKMKCIDCGNDFKIEENLFVCNICGSTNLEIREGKELFIKSLEGE